MEDPDYIILKGACPKCGDQIVAYQDRPLKDRSKVLWFVVCDNGECDFAYPDHFATLEDLAKKFEAED